MRFLGTGQNKNATIAGICSHMCGAVQAIAWRLMGDSWIILISKLMAA
jgi:hypothetical protein